MPWRLRPPAESPMTRIRGPPEPSGGPRSFVGRPLAGARGRVEGTPAPHRPTDPLRSGSGTNAGRGGTSTLDLAGALDAHATSLAAGWPVRVCLPRCAPDGAR